MKLPILAYGQKSLKEKSVILNKDYPNLKQLIEDMWETMKNASGVGLAATQVGHNVRLILVDGTSYSEDSDIDQEQLKFLKTFKHVLINPQIISESEQLCVIEEGCLSIPGIYQKIKRPRFITVKYLDEDFNEGQMELSDLAARIVQHECDHLDGKLFTEHISPLSKKIIEKKLENIRTGKISISYSMKNDKH